MIFIFCRRVWSSQGHTDCPFHFCIPSPQHNDWHRVGNECLIKQFATLLKELEHDQRENGKILVHIMDFFLSNIKEWFERTWESMENILYHSVQFSSVSQSCPTLCDPMNRSTPGLPVPHQLPDIKVYDCGLVTKLCLALVTPWTVACQAPLFMALSRQEYWSGLPLPSPG